MADGDIAQKEHEFPPHAPWHMPAIHAYNPRNHDNKLIYLNKEKMKKRAAYLGNKIRDIHEKDLSHLTQALNSYLEAAKEFPPEVKVIECLEDNKFLPPEVIHQKIWRIIKRIL